MKRLNLFLLLLMAAMVLPATLQAKKIKYGDFIVYDGDVKKKEPCGEGILTMVTSNNATSLKGIFSNDEVTNAVLTLENKWVFKGSLSYSIWAESNSIYYQFEEGELLNNKGDIILNINSSLSLTVNSTVTSTYTNPIINSSILKEVHLNDTGIEIDKEVFGSKVGDQPVDRYGNPEKAKYYGKKLLGGAFEYKYEPLFVIYDDGAKLSTEGYEKTNGDYLKNSTCRLTYPDGTITFDNTRFDFTYSDNSGNEWQEHISPDKHIIITYPDGSKYSGSIADQKGHNGNELAMYNLGLTKVNSVKDLLFPYVKYNGVQTDKNGHEDLYSLGTTNTERETKAASDRQERLKNEQEAYDALCKKYGKQYVDAALNFQVIVGMPEELMVAQFAPQLELKEQGSSYKVYYRRIPKLIKSKYESDYTTHVIWVRNGKVSNVRY